MTSSATLYTGRFAPSPSGPLHFGSLVAALASYLDARSHQGRWLVRIDDIDPPREQPGATDLILQALEQHGLKWDGEVLQQSQRSEAYLALLEQLQAGQLIYPCTCTRQDIKAMGGVYSGHCRHARPGAEPCAWRLKLYDLPGALARLPDTVVFDDLLAGTQRQNLAQDVGDAIVRRKDGLFGYQLAVVADDICQGITHVVRGADLLPVTARQFRFFEILGAAPPHYAHVPVASNTEGRKLSKQNHAPALNNRRAVENLWQALVFLRQNPPSELAGAPRDSLLDWAIAHWRREPLIHAPLTQRADLL